MLTWGEFAAASPELAAWGEKRFQRSRVAYLATIRDDGSPCVRPVTPVICRGHLFLFLDAAEDPCWNGRFAMHSLVDHPSGIGGEFHITGQGTLIESDDVRRMAAAAACYTPSPRHILYELFIERAQAVDYDEGVAQPLFWQAVVA